MSTPTHHDHFGRAIKVGDIVLGAKAGGKYVDTTYVFSVVVSTTPKLIRVHQLGISRPDVHKDVVLSSLLNRCGRPAGKLVPQAVISTGLNVGLTQAEMEAAIEAGRNQNQSAVVSSGCSTIFI